MSDIKLLKDLRVTDLKSELEKRGFATSGVKAVLAERLQKHFEDEGIDADTYDFNAHQDSNDEAIEGKEDCDDGGKEESEVEAPQEEEEEKTAIEEEDGDVVKPSPEEEDNGDDNTAVVDGKVVKETVAEKVSSKEDRDNNAEDDSINLMLGEDEDNLFDEDSGKKDQGSSKIILPKTASPPRPETAPVVQPFTSRDTISMASRSNKAPSENSSMRVAIDESESVGTQESLEEQKQANGEASTKEKESTTSADAAAGSSKDKKDAEESSCCIWVSGLSSNTRAADLKTSFAKVVCRSAKANAKVECFQGLLNLSKIHHYIGTIMHVIVST